MIVSIPDLCPFSYLYKIQNKSMKSFFTNKGMF